VTHRGSAHERVFLYVCHPRVEAPESEAERAKAVAVTTGCALTTVSSDNGLMRATTDED
jgi:hypothetical protein